MHGDFVLEPHRILTQGQRAVLGDDDVYQWAELTVRRKPFFAARVTVMALVVAEGGGGGLAAPVEASGPSPSTFFIRSASCSISR